MVELDALLRGGERGYEQSWTVTLDENLRSRDDACGCKSFEQRRIGLHRFPDGLQNSRRIWIPIKGVAERIDDAR